MAILYFVLGLLFTYLAFVNAKETIWNPITILLLIVATIDIGMGVRFTRGHFQKKKQQKD